MQKWIVGNWKMYGSPAASHPLVEGVAEAAAPLPASVNTVICPPAVLISTVATWLVGSKVHLGGQDCHSEKEGAFTGDISAAMLKEAGCGYVIVGHSERRKLHMESSAQVRAKATAAIASGLIPIICIGETDDERENGLAQTIVGQQVRESLPETAKAGNFLLAYEPVWAIGSGKTPTTADIGQMHTYIKGIAKDAAVLYGGSVKAGNAKEIMGINGVDGVLVGGASLKAEEFNVILRAA